MATFYFTYGLEGQPFEGGWTEIEAESFELAIATFQMYHPGEKACLNCAGVYNEDHFRSTGMYRNGNYGKRCVERIVLKQEVVE